MPTIPLWMGLAAALPLRWPPQCDLLRHHDHPVADRLDGPGARGARPLPGAARGGFRHGGRASTARSEMRIILRHMVPSFTSHIIASITLAIPGMILGETALSFLGLGLRPPVVSWGVLLQDAQNIRAVATAPWLLMPGRCRGRRGAGVQLPGRRPARRRRSVRHVER